MSATGFLDACGFIPTSGGTGTWTVSAAITGYQTPASAGAVNGAVYSYRAQSSDLSQWEEGYGTYTVSGTTLTRTVTASSNSGSAVNFTAAPNVFITALSADLGNASLLTSGTVAPQLVNMTGGFINKFRNGAMDVSQRGTSGSVSAGTTAYTLDGWQVTAAGAACSWSKTFWSGIGANLLQLNAASGLTAVTLQQRIESYIALQMLLVNGGTAQPVTIQFAVYNNTASAITPQIATGYASAQDNFGTVTADLAATNLQTIAAGATGIVSYTYTPNNGIHLGMQVQLLFGGALNAASGWIGVSAADIRATPGLSTGLNSSPPVAERRLIWTELQFSKRYYQTSYPNGVAPGTANTTDLAIVPTINTTNAGTGVSLPVQMRASGGSVTFYDGAGAASKCSLYAGGSWINAETFLTFLSAGENVLWFTSSNANTLAVHYAVSAEL